MANNVEYEINCQERLGVYIRLFYRVLCSRLLCMTTIKTEKEKYRSTCVEKWLFFLFIFPSTSGRKTTLTIFFCSYFNQEKVYLSFKNLLVHGTRVGFQCLRNTFIGKDDIM
jgi:hypothetical protein